MELELMEVNVADHQRKVRRKRRRRRKAQKVGNDNGWYTKS
jgi:hypothetical protein